MKNRFALVFLLLLLTWSGVVKLYAQTDSLLNEFRKTPKTASNVPKLLEISNRLADLDIDIALNCANSIEQIALPPAEFELQCKTLITLEKIAKVSGIYDESNKHLYQALAIAEAHNLIRIKIVCLYEIGDLSRCIGLLDQSLQYLYLSRNFAHLHKINQEFPQLYDRMSATYYQLASPNYNPFEIIIIPNQTELGSGKNLPDDYIELCKLYADSALLFSELNNNTRTKLSSFNTLGAYYRSKKNFQKAIENFGKAIELAEQIGSKTDLPNFYTNIARVYFEQKQYEKAIQFGLIAFRLADTMNITVYKSTAADVLRLAYMEISDYKNALTYQHIEAGAREEMINRQNWNTISELGKKYQTEQKEKEIQYQKNLLKVKNTQLFTRNIIIGILIIAAVAIIISIVIFVGRNKKLYAAYNIIAKQNEELNRANTTKNKLISIIAHDLRGPVGNLSQGLKLIINSKGKSELMQDFIPMLSEQADRTFNMLDNLLQWVRNQLQNSAANLQPRNLYEVLANCIAVSRKYANDKNIEIKLIAPETLIATFDTEMITIIVRNLVSNAIKFTNNGGTITISASQLQNQVMVEVADTGIGFQKENMLRITNKSDYYTSYGTNDEKGTGLGLKICIELIEKNGGTLQVKENSPQGTVFYFNLLA